jgi:hypothetical protein
MNPVLPRPPPPSIGASGRDNPDFFDTESPFDSVLGPGHRRLSLKEVKFAFVESTP